MQKSQIERIMGELAGMTVAEGREIRESVDRSFAEEISKLTFTTSMAETSSARLCTERDQIFR